MAAAGHSRRLFEIFVARVPWTVGPSEVKQYFAQFGSVRKCMLPFDKETGFHKGFCWVGFSTEEGVKNSLQKDTHILEGAKLDVKRQKSKDHFSNRRTADIS